MINIDLPAGKEVFVDLLIFKVCDNLMDNAVRRKNHIHMVLY